MSGSRPPEYDLLTVKERVRSGDPTQVFVLPDALSGAGAVGFDVASLFECVLALEDSFHHETVACPHVDGAFVDVYRIAFRGRRLSVGLQMPHARAVVSLFTQVDAHDKD